MLCRQHNCCVVVSTPCTYLTHLLCPCQALRTVRDDVEKEQAFLGLCRLVRANPEAALASWPSLCAAVCSWRVLRWGSAAGWVCDVDVSVCAACCGPPAWPCCCSLNRLLGCDLAWLPARVCRCDSCCVACAAAAVYRRHSPGPGRKHLGWASPAARVPTSC